MALSTVLGFPRIGAQRELKFALENFWKSDIKEADLLRTAENIRLTHWQKQVAAGIDLLPSNDFSFYDQTLDTSCLLGVVPKRYGTAKQVDLKTYFAMARGLQDKKTDVEASEMTKWFDTNYHYIVPEFAKNQKFRISTTKIFDEFQEAKDHSLLTRPVLVGPLTYLMIGKGTSENNLDLLDSILPVYEDILGCLEVMGADWVQLDEPVLAMDLSNAERAAFVKAYKRLRKATDAGIFLTSYFGAYGDNADTVLKLPVDALHMDLTRGRADFDKIVAKAPKDMILSLGVVDGRNIWRNDLSASLKLIEKAAKKRGSENIWISSSCSLLHTPYDLAFETALDPEIKNWMAFGQQKMEEIAALTRGINEGRAAIADALEASDAAIASRKASPRLHRADVAARMKQQPLKSAGRAEPYKERKIAQDKAFGLPLYPTTTIGSFPQTPDVRRMRLALKQNKISQKVYDAFIEEQIKDVIDTQNEIGLDVLVHGEFERNDMVEYFGERLDGFTFTKNGWVQSYGSRCVKPPVIYGDVARPQPMTVAWSSYAKSLSDKPVKGMLTGPVTILQWSFVRDDQPRRDTTHQIALALLDEVLDLEKAGIRIIQIDEPAFREGLPLRGADEKAYLTWATQAFRLSSTGVMKDTQIHTHMCYCEFNDIIPWIKAMDADVISIEASRSKMELLGAFINFKYPMGIGPGVYDIHSPRVPSVAEMVALLERASRRLASSQLWVNPDCGLKTRAWPETKAALKNMVAAAKKMRSGKKA